jgi:excinuclease ABC subunit C
VAALQVALNLERPPERIEGFDISNIQGQKRWGAMVVFENGEPRKGHYRRFRIRTVFQANDFAMMAEVIRRRYSGSLRDKLPLPDLILIDGGKGQLGAAREVLKELGLGSILPLAWPKSMRSCMKKGDQSRTGCRGIQWRCSFCSGYETNRTVLV